MITSLLNLIIPSFCCSEELALIYLYISVISKIKLKHQKFALKFRKILLKFHHIFFFSFAKRFYSLLKRNEKFSFVSYYAIYHCLLKEILLNTVAFLSEENNKYFLQFTEILFFKILYLFKTKTALNTTRIIF